MIGTSPPAPEPELLDRIDDAFGRPSGLRERVMNAADPDRVVRSLLRLDDAAHDQLTEMLRRELVVLDALIGVCDASRFLVEHLVRRPADTSAIGEAIEAPLETEEIRAPRDDNQLRLWRRRLTLRIAARDVMGLATLDDVGMELAAVADAALEAAVEMAGASDAPFAVLGMGKLGGQELNYSSDVDVLFVHDGDGDDARRFSQSVIRALSEVTSEGIALRVDADLRPEGRSGPLSRTLDAYRSYWERWAEPWEFQALLKARAAAGHRGLAEAFLAAAEPLVYRESLDGDFLRAIRRMKARAETEVGRNAAAGDEVKRGPGGIRDVEFAVQLLQLVHGRHDADLRARGTLPALEEMARGGYVGPDDAATLELAYRFLRTVEHRLQLEDDRQTHTLPADAPSRAHLARVLGYRDHPTADAREQFERAMRQHQSAVRTVHERLFYRPLLEAFSAAPAWPDAMSPDVALERLAAAGFRRHREAGDALLHLTRGLSRTSRMMRRLLPLMLEWLSESPDPDLGLLQLRHLVENLGDTTALVVAFRDNPVAAERLCRVVGTSRLVGDILRRHPESVLTLGDPDAGGSKTAGALRAEALRHLGLRTDRQAALRRFKRREFVRIAARDILDQGGDPGAELSALADACLEAALGTAQEDIAGPERPRMAVVAFGRYGGGELSYASDLDVMFVHEGGAHGAAEKVAERVRVLLSDITREGQTFELDADLRPEGKAGILSRPLAGYESYWERWAEPWEFLALLRARPAAGDAALGADFMSAAHRAGLPEELPPEWLRQIRHMKARMERERIPAGEDRSFHLKLGRGSLSDVEFTVQLLQLRHRVAGAGVAVAADELVGRGHLSAPDAGVLIDSYRFCNRVRDRLFLIRGRPTDSLPTDPDEARRLAESLAFPTVAELREVYRRLTRRARAVVDRLFWGK